MRRLILGLLLLAGSLSHAQVKFDKWNLSELLVTGLKAARERDLEAQDKVLDQMRLSLAQLNVDLAHQYPKDPEAGLAAADEILSERVIAAWKTEADERNIDAQRQFMERALATGHGDEISKATKTLARRWQNTHWSGGVYLRNHAALATGVATVMGTAIGTAFLFHTPFPAIIGAMGSILGYAGGCAGLCDYNRDRRYEYEANVISPVLRNCEVALNALERLPLRKQINGD